jgi:hypothetical protein
MDLKRVSPLRYNAADNGSRYLMKIMLTNDEMKNASRLQVFFSVSVGSVIFTLVLVSICLLLLFVFHLLTSIPLKVYLAALILVLLLILFRVKRNVPHESK